MQEDVIKEAREKWEKVERCLAELITAIYANCSFCDYYVDCEKCPLGEVRPGRLGKHCVKYGLVVDALDIQQEAAYGILKVINAVGECQHTKELEATNEGDKQRVFICSFCGRHRIEPLSSWLREV